MHLTLSLLERSGELLLVAKVFTPLVFVQFSCLTNWKLNGFPGKFICNGLTQNALKLIKVNVTITCLKSLKIFQVIIRVLYFSPDQLYVF